MTEDGHRQEEIDNLTEEEAMNEDETQNVTIEAEEGNESAAETDSTMEDETEEEGTKTEEEKDQETGMRDMVTTIGMITKEIERNVLSINTVASAHTRRDQAMFADLLMRNPEKMMTVSPKVEDLLTEGH